MTKLAKQPNCQYVGYGQTIESVHGDLVHPPNLTCALGKGHMSSFFWQFVSSSTHLIRFQPNLITMMPGGIVTKVILCVTSGVIQGSQGSKVHFHKKRFNSSIFFMIIMIFIHMKQLDIVFQNYKYKFDLGSFEVREVKKRGQILNNLK